MTGKQANGSDAVASQAAGTIALQMLEERGRGAVLVGVARVDAALEHLLQAVMAQTPARTNPLWAPLEAVLATQPPSASGVIRQDPAG
jgi:hypothetical protein